MDSQWLYRITLESHHCRVTFIDTTEGEYGGDLAWIVYQAMHAVRTSRLHAEIAKMVLASIEDDPESLATEPDYWPGHNEAMEALRKAATALCAGWDDFDEAMRKERKERNG